MSDTSQGPGWWQASDDKWYPPELHPSYRAPPPPSTAAVPTAQPPQRPGQPASPNGHQPPKRKRKTRPSAYVALGAVVVLLIITVASSGGNKKPKSSASKATIVQTTTAPVATTAPATATTAAPTTTTSPPKPAPTQSVTSKVAAWWTLVKPDFQAVTDAFSTLQSSAGTLPRIGQACSHLTTAVDALETDPPAPVTAVNTPYQSALTDWAKGGEECSLGIDQDDMTLIDQATTDFTTGNSEIAQATGEIKALGGEG